VSKKSVSRKSSTKGSIASDRAPRRSIASQAVGAGGRPTRCVGNVTGGGSASTRRSTSATAVALPMPARTAVERPRASSAPVTASPVKKTAISAESQLRVRATPVAASFSIKPPF